MVQSSAKGERGRRLAICEDLDAADAESVVPRAYDLLERVAPVGGRLVEVLHAVNADLQRANPCQNSNGAGTCGVRVPLQR